MKKILLLSFVLTLLSGCSQTQMNELTSTLGDTLGSLVSIDTGNGDKKMNSTTNSTSNSTTKSEKASGTFTLTVPQDVDTVFASEVNEFNFPSPEWLRQTRGDNADFIMQDGYYHFEKTPGSYYHLGYGYVKHKNSKVAMEMKLLKSGKGTKILVEYDASYFDYKGSKVTLEKEITQRIKNALK